MLAISLALLLGSDRVQDRRQTVQELVNDSRQIDDRREKVRDAIQLVLDQSSVLFNASVSFGFAERAGTLSLAAGQDDIFEKTPLLPTTMIPAGSTTKTWTAVAIMQAVEAGKIQLDDKAVNYIDPVLARLNGTTMTALWNGTRWPIGRVTIRNLLQHTGGIMEYDGYLPWNVDHPNDDLTPIDIVHLVSKALLCDSTHCTCEHLSSLPFPYYKPDTDGCLTESRQFNKVSFYSSVDYILLGFVLLQLQLAEGGDGSARTPLPPDTWQHLDQRRILPRRKGSYTYNHTTFNSGPCSKVPGVAHQYYVNEADIAVADFQLRLASDIIRYSCSNGWSAGNIAASPGDLATFFYDMFHVLQPDHDDDNEHHADDDEHSGGGGGQRAGLLSRKSLDEMKNHMVNDIVLGLPYGLGLYDNRESMGVWGHGGADFGSSAYECGYNPGNGTSRASGFGICLMFASNRGMNCSLAPQSLNTEMQDEVMCKVFNAVHEAVGMPELVQECGDVREDALLDESETEMPCVWQPHATVAHTSSITVVGNDGGASARRHWRSKQKRKTSSKRRSRETKKLHV